MIYPKSMIEFMENFHSEDQCIKYLENIRFPDGCMCNKCGGKEFWTHKRGHKVCKNCRADLRVTAGTVLHKIKVPLMTVFIIAWFLVSSKRGISAEELSSIMQVNYKTVWTWLQKFRRVMIIPGRNMLKGDVEIDEVFIGGKKSGKRGRGAEGKKKVVIAIEANKTNPNDEGEIKGMGRVRMKVVPDCKRETLLSFINDNVEKGSNIFTDGWRGYSRLEDKGYKHIIEDEKKHKDVVGVHKDGVLPNVHIVASLVKRWLLGTHQKYLAKGQHLDHYLDEYTFRFNRRKSSDRGKLFYTLMKELMSQEYTTFDKIVNKKK